LYGVYRVVDYQRCSEPEHKFRRIDLVDLAIEKHLELFVLLGVA